MPDAAVVDRHDRVPLRVKRLRPPRAFPLADHSDPRPRAGPLDNLRRAVGEPPNRTPAAICPDGAEGRPPRTDLVRPVSTRRPSGLADGGAMALANKPRTTRRAGHIATDRRQATAAVADPSSVSSTKRLTSQSIFKCAKPVGLSCMHDKPRDHLPIKVTRARTARPHQYARCVIAVARGSQPPERHAPPFRTQTSEDGFSRATARQLFT